MFTLTNRAGGVNDIMKSDIPMMSVMTNVHFIPCFETYTKLIDNLEQGCQDTCHLMLTQPLQVVVNIVNNTMTDVFEQMLITLTI